MGTRKTNQAKATKASSSRAKGKARPKLAAVPAEAKPEAEPQERDPRVTALCAEARALFGQEGIDAVGDEVMGGCGPWVTLLEVAANVDKAGARMGHDAANLNHALNASLPTPREPDWPADDPELYVALRLLNAVRCFVSRMDGADEDALFTDKGHRACCVVARGE